MKKLKESEEGKRLRAQMKELGISDNMIWDGKDLSAKLAKPLLKGKNQNSHGIRNR